MEDWSPHRRKTWKFRRIDQSIAMYAILIDVKVVAPARMRASTADCPAKAMMGSTPLIYLRTTTTASRAEVRKSSGYAKTTQKGWGGSACPRQSPWDKFAQVGRTIHGWLSVYV